MTSQFKSIIEKIKTDKNVQVAVASIAAATVLVIGGTTYYFSKTYSQSSSQIYKRVTSVGSKKYEKVRDDDASDVKLDDKLVESISSTNFRSSSTAVNSDSSNDSSSSSESTQSTQSTQSTKSDRSDDSNVQEVSSDSKEDYKDHVESDSRKKDSSKTKESETKVLEIYSNRKNSKSKRSTDQSDWGDGETERTNSEEVSSDNWNDEDGIEELNLHR